MLSLCLVFISFTSCTGTTSQNDNTDNSLSIVTTIFPVYDWAKNIAGDNWDVTYLDGSGTDMHSFEPTAKDIITIADADIFICIGGKSDSWVEAAVNSSENDKIVVLKLIGITGGLKEEFVDGMQHEEHSHDADVSEFDEHIWLSLKNAQTCVSAIAEKLGGIDPSNKDLYLSNAENYNTELAELDKKYADTVETAKQHTLIFADRFPFRYLTEDYGIEYYAAFPGCSAESEASFETITFLIEKTKELGIEHLIILENSDGKLADTVAHETDVKILTLNSCQSVTSTEIENGKTYLSVMEENLSVLTEALS